MRRGILVARPGAGPDLSCKLKLLPVLQPSPAQLGSGVCRNYYIRFIQPFRGSILVNKKSGSLRDAKASDKYIVDGGWWYTFP